MKFELFCPVFNESYILPYFVKFYQDKVGKDNIIFNIYDNGSEDNTVEVAKELGCNVGRYETGGEVRDDLLMHFKNTIWKGSKADYVIVVDADEFVDIDVDKLKGYTLLKSEGWNMVGDGIQTPDQIIHGIRHIPEDKTCVFSPLQIQEMNYDAGAHNCSPIGYIKVCPTRAKLYHMKVLSEQYLIEKYQSSQKRLSKINLQYGWGSQYNQPIEELKTMYRHMLNGKVKVR